MKNGAKDNRQANNMSKTIRNNSSDSLNHWKKRVTPAQNSTPRKLWNPNNFSIHTWRNI